MNRVPSLEYVTVSKDAYDFLKHMLFGAWDSIYVAASERAYRDMCRTLHLGDADSKKLRNTVDHALEVEIQAALSEGFTNQQQYDTWHEDICGKISTLYRAYGIELTVGQAQKWLNMTMKYLFIADVPGIADVFYFCHVPVDSYIIEAAEKQLGLKRPGMPWSKIPNYDSYAEYQREIRTRLGNTAPLEWEFDTWIKAAVDKKGREHASRAGTE